MEWGPALQNAYHGWPGVGKMHQQKSHFVSSLFAPFIPSKFDSLLLLVLAPRTLAGPKVKGSWSWRLLPFLLNVKKTEKLWGEGRVGSCLVKTHTQLKLPTLAKIPGCFRDLRSSKTTRPEGPVGPGKAYFGANENGWPMSRDSPQCLGVWWLPALRPAQEWKASKMTEVKFLTRLVWH